MFSKKHTPEMRGTTTCALLLLASTWATSCASSSQSTPKPSPAPFPVAPESPRESVFQPATWLQAKLEHMTLSGGASNGSPLSNIPLAVDVVITNDRVSFEGGALTTKPVHVAGRIQKLDALADALRARREEMKKEDRALHPHPVIRYWVDRKASAVVVKSAFQTAAFSGFPYGEFVVQGEGGQYQSLPLDASIPGRPFDGGFQPKPVDVAGRKVPAPLLSRTVVGGNLVSGRLPAEVIRNIVRDNFGKFRACYEEGLGRDPDLEGLVAIRFVIGRDGKVSNVGQGKASLPSGHPEPRPPMPDEAVVQCILDHFSKLEFPEPVGGIVTVTYPIMFSPAE